MFTKKTLGVSLTTLSFGLMAGCSSETSDTNTVTAPITDAENLPIQNEVASACGDFIQYVDAISGSTYCFDTNNQLQFSIDAAGNFVDVNVSAETPITSTPDSIVDENSSTGSVNPSIEISDSVITKPSIEVPKVETCNDPIDGPIAINKMISSADGSTYMYDASCNKIMLTLPTVTEVSSSSKTNDTPASSASNNVSEEISSANEEVSGISSSSYETVSNGNFPVVSYTASGAAITNSNGCITANGGEVVITCAGEYDFSGSYKGADAQIRVHSPKADSGVYLNLRGLSLENTADAPIYVQVASKTFVVAKSGSVNTLIDGATRTREYTYQNDKGETKTDTTGATIYSKDDLTIKGEGTLNIKGNYNNGIQSSNDLRFRGETIVSVEAKNNGLKGKGKVDIEKGNITIAATAGDGIKSDECTVNGSDTTITEGKGIVSIKGGTINITKAGDDGIQAFNYIQIADSVAAPTINIASSGKGIVSENRVYINAGKVTVNSGDDGVHSNLNVYFNGGYTTISAKGNDGVHADSTLYINNGTIYVKDSYEGLEAWYIRASGGITDIYASDDGWNAAGGNDGSGNSNQSGNNNWGRPGSMGGGMGGMGSSSGFLIVTGGIHYLKTGSGDTDGMDSNGELTISGGVVVVECQISGGMGGSFDSDGTATITSKTLLGFSGRQRSEAGTNYTLSFNTNSYYGNSSIAFKPTTTGSYVQGTSQVAVVNDISNYSKNVVLPSGGTIYYNN